MYTYLPLNSLGHPCRPLPFHRLDLQDFCILSRPFNPELIPPESTSQRVLTRLPASARRPLVRPTTFAQEANMDQKEAEAWVHRTNNIRSSLRVRKLVNLNLELQDTFKTPCRAVGFHEPPTQHPPRITVRNRSLTLRSRRNRCACHGRLFHRRVAHHLASWRQLLLEVCSNLI